MPRKKTKTPPMNAQTLTLALPKEKPRNVAAVNMFNRRQKAGAFPDLKKEKNKKACRGKVRDE